MAPSRKAATGSGTSRSRASAAATSTRMATQLPKARGVLSALEQTRARIEFEGLSREVVMVKERCHRQGDDLWRLQGEWSDTGREVLEIKDRVADTASVANDAAIAAAGAAAAKGASGNINANAAGGEKERGNGSNTTMMTTIRDEVEDLKEQLEAVEEGCIGLLNQGKETFHGLRGLDARLKEHVRDLDARLTEHVKTSHTSTLDHASRILASDTRLSSRILASDTRVSRLEAENATLKATMEECRGENIALKAEVEECRGDTIALKAEMAELQRFKVRYEPTLAVITKPGVVECLRELALRKGELFCLMNTKKNEGRKGDEDVVMGLKKDQSNLSDHETNNDRKDMPESKPTFGNSSYHRAPRSPRSKRHHPYAKPTLSSSSTHPPRGSQTKTTTSASKTSIKPQANTSTPRTLYSSNPSKTKYPRPVRHILKAFRAINQQFKDAEPANNTNNESHVGYIWAFLDRLEAPLSHELQLLLAERFPRSVRLIPVIPTAGHGHGDRNGEGEWEEREERESVRIERGLRWEQIEEWLRGLDYTCIGGEGSLFLQKQ